MLEDRGLHGGGRLGTRLGQVYQPFITPCACAAGGRVIGLCLSVCPQSKRGLSSGGLVEGLFQDRSVRIQKILAST